MWQTRITDLLGIEHPFICSGMTYVSDARLAAAVSEAGGLGLIQIGHLTPDEARAEIRRARTLTQKPFGVGLALMMPGALDNARVAIEEQVPVINYSLGKGEAICRAVKAYGGKVLATVVNARHAKAAERDGADALIVTGLEAAAHGGDVTTMVLVPAIRQVTSLPLIAAGGMADGRTLPAILALGGDGVAMGTRWAMTQESPLHPSSQAAVAQATIHDTLHTRNFDGMPCRILDTPTARAVTRRPLTPWRALWVAWRALRAEGRSIGPVLDTLRRDGLKAGLGLAYFGAAVTRIRQAILEGNHEQGVQLIGQAQGLIDDVPTCAALMSRLLSEAEAAARHVQSHQQRADVALAGVTA